MAMANNVVAHISKPRLSFALGQNNNNASITALSSTRIYFSNSAFPPRGINSIDLYNYHRKNMRCRRLSTNNVSHVSPSSTTGERSHHGRLPKDFLSTLRSLHPDLKISTNHYDLESHGHGESYHPSAPPDAVIYPKTEDEIVDILRLCCRQVVDDITTITDENIEAGDGITTVEVVSVIPYGAGTSLEGHLCFLHPGNGSDIDEIVDIPTSLFSNPGNDVSNKFQKVRVKRKGGISIDMSFFQSIGEVASGDLFVKVGAGVTRNALNAALR